MINPRIGIAHQVEFDVDFSLVGAAVGWTASGVLVLVKVAKGVAVGGCVLVGTSVIAALGEGVGGSGVEVAAEANLVPG